MKTDFSIYPQGKRSYLIPDWDNCDPYQIIPNSTDLAGKKPVTEPALSMAYLKTNVDSTWNQKNSKINFIVGKEGDILIIWKRKNKNSILEAYRASDLSWEIGIIHCAYILPIVFG